MHDAVHQIPTLPHTSAAAIDDLLRDALMHDAGCAVAVLEAGGCILECNDAFAQVLGESTPAAVEGQPIQSKLDEAATRSLHHAMRHVLDHFEPIVVETVLGDRFVRTTYRPMHTDSPGPMRVLLVIAPWDPDTPPASDAKLHRPKSDRSNPLASLTPREREVLKHIGMGLPTAEIARQLHRSVKTIEGHRVALGLKLGVSNRVQLARIAIRSGLSPLSAIAVETKPAPAARALHPPISRAICVSTGSGRRR